MRLPPRLSHRLLITGAVLLALFQPVAGQGSAPALQVTGKTATTVSLSWGGWNTPAPTRHDLYRNGAKVHSWGADTSRPTYTDRNLGWGTTFAYFLRRTFSDGSIRDTNPVWVTTNAPGTPLNVIVILTDDQRWDTLQYMPWVQQLLVQHGATFTQAFVSTPQCCPSRSSLLSGLYSHNHGVLSNRLGARYFNDGSTLATWLHAAGYRTGLIGKYLNGYVDAGCANIYGRCFINVSGVHAWPYVPPGWDDWHAFRIEDYYDYRLVENGTEVAYGATAAEYSTGVLAAKAVDFINTTSLGQPFFLLFSPRAPHIPATVAGTVYDGLFANIAPWRPPSYNEADVSDKPAWVRKLALWTPTETDTMEALRKRQLASLQAVDLAVKMIYDAVAARGELDRTVFIFTSDNGQAWGEHRWEAKMCAYDECTRVPLVIRTPNGPVRNDAHLITLMDLVPSIAAWSGILHPKLDGVSLARLVVDQNVAWRDALLLEMLDGESGDQQAMLFSAIRTKQYLYVRYLNGDRELYNLATDPYLLTNVASQPAYATVIATLKAQLAALKGQ